MTGAERQHSVDSPLACYYAGDPDRRPRCTAAATVRVGAVVLCASCNAARSSLGKGQRQVPLPAGPELDVLGWVASAHQQARPPDSTGRVNAKPARVGPYRINHACRPGSVRNRSRLSKA